LYELAKHNISFNSAELTPGIQRYVCARVY